MIGDSLLLVYKMLMRYSKCKLIMIMSRSNSLIQFFKTRSPEETDSNTVVWTEENRKMNVRNERECNAEEYAYQMGPHWWTPTIRKSLSMPNISGNRRDIG